MSKIPLQFDQVEFYVKNSTLIRPNGSFGLGKTNDTHEMFSTLSRRHLQQVCAERALKQACIVLKFRQFLLVESMVVSRKRIKITRSMNNDDFR